MARVKSAPAVYEVRTVYNSSTGVAADDGLRWCRPTGINSNLKCNYTPTQSSHTYTDTGLDGYGVTDIEQM